MIIVIDNYDSFTYNLVQYLGELGSEIQVFRNNQITLSRITKMAPSHIIISPGPGTPIDGGISIEVIRNFYRLVPILGVCLGHQCIGHVFGGVVSRAPRLMHGKTSLIHHDGKGVFREVPNPFEGGRYHSLIVENPVPRELIVTASTPEGEVMGLRHCEFPLEGVQFHPESVLTQFGKKMLSNFLNN